MYEWSSFKPLTDEQVFYDKFFYDKFTLPSVRVYAQQFFMTSLSLTSLSVVVRRHDAYTKCIIHVGRRTIGLNLLWQVFFVDRTDGQVFTLPIFSMTSALVEKLKVFVYQYIQV